MIADVNNCKLGNTQVKKIYNNGWLIFTELYPCQDHLIIGHSDAMNTIVMDSLFNKLSTYPEGIREFVNTSYNFFFLTLNDAQTYYTGHINENNEIVMNTVSPIESLVILFDNIDTDCFWTTKDTNTFYKYKLNADRTTELITTITPNAKTITGFIPQNSDNKHNFCCYDNYIYFVNGGDGHKNPIRFNKDGTNIIYNTDQAVFNSMLSIHVNDNGVYVSSYDGIIKYDHNLNLISYYTGRGSNASKLLIMDNGNIINGDYILDKDLNIVNEINGYSLKSADKLCNYILLVSNDDTLCLYDGYDVVKRVQYSEFNWVRATVIKKEV